MLCDSFEAEDAMQNLYLKLWERKDELSNLVSPEGYCRALLKNICIDRWRVIRTRHEEADEGCADDIVGDINSDIETRETRLCIRQFLQSLPEQQRRVMLMKINGKSFEEIEEVTGLSAVNIRVIVSRLRKRFREYYKKI